MNTAEQVVATARSQQGVAESPANSNCTPYRKPLGRPCEQWCADFVSWVLAIALRLDMRLFGLGPTGSAACVVWTEAMRRLGRLHVGWAPKVACLVHFGAGGGSHIGFVVAVGPDWFDYTSGNTGQPVYSGGLVATHRVYNRPGNDVYGFSWPWYLDPAPPLNLEELVEPIVLVRNDVPAGQPKTAWLVMVTGEGPCGCRRIAMGDAQDLRNRPDGYGPPVEVDKDQLGAIPLMSGPAPGNV